MNGFIHEFFKIIFAQPEQLKHFCDPKVLLHWRGGYLAHGVDELIVFCQDQHQYFPDLKFDIQTIIIDNTDIAVRVIQRGTMKKSWSGLRNIGATFSVAESFFFKLKEGKIIEIWPLVDLDDKKMQIKF